MQNWRKWLLDHDGTSWLPKTRDSHWSSSKLGTSLCKIFMEKTQIPTNPLQIPNCKVKYGSYPSKNIPYFIHFLSLHVFFRISGLTLQISGLALPIWGCATNKKNVLKMFCGIYNIVAELLKSYINCPATNPSVDVRKSVKWDALFDMYKTKIATLIYKIFHRITPSSLERLIIQRGQNKYDLCHITIVSYHHHRVWIKVVVISGRICWSFN